MFPTDCDTRMLPCRWLQESVFGGLLGLQPRFYCDDAWFNLSGYITRQNNRCYSTENHDTLHEVPLQNLKFGVRLVRRGYLGSYYFTIINIEYYVTWILSPFFGHLTREKMLWTYFAS